MEWVPIRHCLLLHRITHLARNTRRLHINRLFSLPLEVILRRLCRDQLRRFITSNRWSLDVLRLVFVRCSSCTVWSCHVKHKLISSNRESWTKLLEDVIKSHELFPSCKEIKFSFLSSLFFEFTWLLDTLKHGGMVCQCAIVYAAMQIINLSINSCLSMKN